MTSVASHHALWRASGPGSVQDIEGKVALELYAFPKKLAAFTNLVALASPREFVLLIVQWGNDVTLNTMPLKEQELRCSVATDKAEGLIDNLLVWYDSLGLQAAGRSEDDYRFCIIDPLGQL